MRKCKEKADLENGGQIKEKVKLKKGENVHEKMEGWKSAEKSIKRKWREKTKCGSWERNKTESWVENIREKVVWESKVEM